MTSEILNRLRAARGFDPAEVAGAKIGRIVRWLRAQKLDSAVVGVSGGVDSALVLALLREAQKAGGSPLKRVIALLLPIAGRGATRQEEASERGAKVARALGAEVWHAPLGDALAETIASLERASGLSFDAWSEGQCLSIVRTPALYGAVALLRAHGHAAVVFGTTNRDEGAYLGFFGKASDGMVDVQVISDLHKSEVRALARHLGVPEEVVCAVPRGDVHDGRSDEELIGARYDDVETVIRLLELGRDPRAVGDAFVPIQRAHEANRHKYVSPGFAVHLDVMPRGVPGGWDDVAFSGRGEIRPARGALPGEWDPPPIALDPANLPSFEDLSIGHGFARHVRGLLTHDDCARLIHAMEDVETEPVGVTGLRNGQGIGSVRATAWSAPLAAELFARLLPALPSVRFTGELTPTDGFATAEREGHRSWRIVGLSPVLRFMRYPPGGRHLCHYDAGFDYGDGRRTLLSVVFYLSDAVTSGATRFVRDGQEALPIARRDFADWSRDAREDEVILRVQPRRGDALVFDHRLCHDVERWDGPGARSVIRADVVYEAVPDGR